MLHGHVAQAWQSNALLVVLMPFAAIYLGMTLRRLCRRSPEVFPRVPLSAMYLLGAATAIFTFAVTLLHRNYRRRNKAPMQTPGPCFGA